MLGIFFSTSDVASRWHLQSSLCQASIPCCASTQYQLILSSGICFWLPKCMELTEWWLRHPTLSSDNFGHLLKTWLFQSTYSTLEVSHFMRCVHSQLTDLQKRSKNVNAAQYNNLLKYCVCVRLQWQHYKTPAATASCSTYQNHRSVNCRFQCRWKSTYSMKHP